MNRIVILLFIFSVVSQTHASEVTITGGFTQDYAQWESGYNVIVTHIDGETIKKSDIKLNIKSEKEEIKISQGTHTVRLYCSFKVEPKVSLAGQKDVTLIFNRDTTYKLSAIINFDKDKEVRRKKAEERRKQGITERPKYCEPAIDELEANKSSNLTGAENAPPS